jgi:hypothetical protein
MDLMELQLSVVANCGRDGTFHSSTKLPNAFIEAFEPMRTCDDRRLAMATAELVPGDAAYMRKRKLREDIAQYLSTALTRMLLEQMRRADTHNGWPKDASS